MNEVLQYNDCIPTVGGNGLTMPYKVTPSQYLFEPLAVSGIMYAPTATGEGASFSGEGLSANAALVSANGNEIRLSGGYIKFTPPWDLYGIWNNKKPYPMPYMGLSNTDCFPGSSVDEMIAGGVYQDVYDLQPLIFSAQVKINKQSSNSLCHLPMLPISGWSNQKYNITVIGAGIKPMSASTTGEFHDFTWEHNVGNGKPRIYVDGVLRSTDPITNYGAYMSAVDGISAYNCDITIKDPKLIFFSNERGSRVNRWWTANSQYQPDKPAYSAYYPDGKPDYIANSGKPVFWWEH